MEDSEYFTNTTGLEIAIIGMSGCFPEASNIEQFWQNLRDGVESIHRFTDQELQNLGVDAALINDPNYVKAEGRVEGIDLFDAAFFDFSPREAEILDPSLRFFLEYSWKALEDAGYSSQIYKKPIGVYAGTSFGSYLLNIYSNYDVIASVGDKQIEKGTSTDYVTTLVSYKLNLQGPSYAVQTTCSSSLVAVHLACQSLLSGECDIALAGGVSISTADGYLYQEGGIESPDGHCRAFDAKAAGTVKGRGLGLVVLKRLEEAIADQDCIHAIIKGSAINNDGADKVSYTAPSVNGQAKVIRAAQVMAEVEPETISYIEAHGTGTSLGDPVEIAALTQAFRTKTQKKEFCAIGSVKTNIGHLDATAGVAGLIKTVLALKHKQIPPSLNFEKPSPQIDFANSPFYVNNQLSEWKANNTPRRAGVSSFGFGGTNAHIILEEAPRQQESMGGGEQGRKYQLLLLSAKTNTALETATKNFVNHLQTHPDLNFADVAHTLQVGRWAFNHRRMVVCQNQEDAINALQDPQRTFTSYQEPCNRSILFMFSGQGSQYVNMGRELYENESIFREQVDYCCELLKPHLQIDLRTVLYPSEEKIAEATQKLQQTAITQPALFVIEYAMTKLWMAWGVSPEAMIGHSIGEYVAATIAGVFTLEDALIIVATRGKLMQELPGGAMLSVQLPEEKIQQFIEQGISLAAINAPTSCVVSGSYTAIDKLQEKLPQIGVNCRRLHTSHAFHSPMMSPIIKSFIQSFQKIKLNAPKIPFISNVSGTWITAIEATDPQYWARHLRQPVNFSLGISQLLKQPEQVLLEVGPGRTLSSLAKQHQTDVITLTSIRHPQEQQSDIEFLLNTLGRLWLVGIQIDWSGFYANEKRRRLPLPTYPFERQRYWIEVNRNATLAMMSAKASEKKPDIADWFYVPRWKESTPVEFLQQDKLLEDKSFWLIFVDNYGVGIEIADRLQQQNQNVIFVRVGDNFTKLDDCNYVINPQESNDYDTLFQTLQEQHLIQEVRQIAHFWSLTSNDILPSHELNPKTQYQFFEDCQNLGFDSLLFLAQALVKQNIIDPINLMVVTSNLHDVTGSENLCPEKATILGPCNVIPQEYLNITCCCFDIVLADSKTKPSATLIDSLLTEFTTPITDNLIAYRGNHRWIKTYEAVRLDESVTSKSKLRKGGVYLITGGLGRIGLAMSEYLAKTVQAKLILIGRKSLPERHQWSEWLLNHDEFNEVSQKLKKVMMLEELGAEVQAISADVANEEQMQKAIYLAKERFGEIHGVIHTAGINDDAYYTIEESSKAQSQAQFSPKVYGLFVLEKVLQCEKLDFCLFTSSSSSVLGGLGLTSYSAANIFMDAYAHKQNQTNLFPCISVNWDTWQSESGDIQDLTVGLALEKLRMTWKEGIDVFSRVLCLNKTPQIVVSAGELQPRIEQWIKRQFLQNNVENLSLHSRGNLQNEYVPASNQVEQIVATTWQKLLGIEKIGIYDNFFDLGGSSLIGVEVISQLQKELNTHIPIISIYERPTISSLAEFLTREEEVVSQKDSYRPQVRSASIKRRKEARQSHRRASQK
ncbi:type I polyketide synthase [Nostoc sp. 2RC]|uniref:type I polyketide synthase n=1 Tax=Nostoc sp. 2RC TaxID=2485484 RepID=UPI00162A8ED3|nr:type I polyketide synthase [Nostoc sp. 2RC]MBC1235674.1 SDR family oxidoreductase [Nostoc sp. 2RC]